MGRYESFTTLEAYHRIDADLQEMLPRKPSRLEMKADDMQEYDEMKERQIRAAAGATSMKTDEHAHARVPQHAGGQQTKAERVGLVKK